MFTTQTDQWTPFLEELSALLEAPGSFLSAVGSEIKTCTLENFGQTGTNRPIDWQTPLSKSYQRKLKKMGIDRDYPTLELTGALKESVSVSSVGDDSVTVTARNDKASWHQDGEGNNPPRPFFPVFNGEMTDYCQSRISTALDEYFKPQ